MTGTRAWRRATVAGDREAGALTVMVALLMSVLMASAALTLDLGNAWQAKRRLETATDAAAMAAAQAFAESGISTSCSGAASPYLAANYADAALTLCSPVGANGAGYVTVKAKATVDYNFAGFVDVDSAEVVSSTTARWGSPSAVSDLRPLALCLAYPGLASWLNLPSGPTGPSGNISVPFTNSYSGCPGSGNWGWLDYAGGGSGASTVAEWILHGYSQPVSIPSYVPAKTGADSSLAAALATMLGQTFPIAMHDTITDSGGTNTEFHIVAVAIVKLVSFQLTGNDRGFVFQFLRGVVDGTCCGTGPSTGALVTGVCAYASDPKTGQCA